MPGATQSSHPAVEAKRRYYSQKVAIVRAQGAIWEAMKRLPPTDAAHYERSCQLGREEEIISEELHQFEHNVNAALDVIEPELARGAFDTIPEQLRSKAYMDGVDIWARGAPYTNSKESETRVINDATIRDELLDLRQRFIDRSLEAEDDRDAGSVLASYHNDAVKLVLGSHNQGLRSLGPDFDKRLLDARRRYKDRLVRARGLSSGTAFQDYHRAVLGIVLDFLASIDKEQEAKDRKEVVADEAPPAPEPQPAPVPISRIAKVEVVDSQSTPSAAEREQEFERKVTQEVERSLAEGPDVALFGKLQTSAATMPYEQYDKKLTEAWKEQPPQPPSKRKKARAGDLL